MCGGVCVVLYSTCKCASVHVYMCHCVSVRVCVCVHVCTVYRTPMQVHYACVFFKVMHTVAFALDL